MYQEGDRVIVLAGREKGVIEKVSTFRDILGRLGDDTPCYYVSVPARDDGINRWRWLADKIIGELKATENYTVEQLKVFGMVGVYRA